MSAVLETRRFVFEKEVNNIFYLINSTWFGMRCGNQQVRHFLNLAATEFKNIVKGAPILHIIIRKCSTIFQLLS